MVTIMKVYGKEYGLTKTLIDFLSFSSINIVVAYGKFKREGGFNIMEVKSWRQ